MCELCKREVRTKFYFETDKFWCINCEVCKIPMIVLKEHRARFTEEEKGDIFRLVLKHFGKDKIDYNMRNIVKHAHCHVR